MIGTVGGGWTVRHAKAQKGELDVPSRPVPKPIPAGIGALLMTWHFVPRSSPATHPAPIQMNHPWLSTGWFTDSAGRKYE